MFMQNERPRLNESFHQESTFNRLAIEKGRPPRANTAMFAASISLESARLRGQLAPQ
jgi:hypothetical protein